MTEQGEAVGQFVALTRARMPFPSGLVVSIHCLSRRCVASSDDLCLIPGHPLTPAEGAEARLMSVTGVQDSPKIKEVQAQVLELP